METAHCSVIYVLVDAQHSVLDTSFVLCDEHDKVLRLKTYSFPFNYNLLSENTLESVLSDSISLLRQELKEIDIPEDYVVVKYISKNKYLPELSNLRKADWNFVESDNDRFLSSRIGELSGEVCYLNMEYDRWTILCVKNGKNKFEKDIKFYDVDELVKFVDIRKLSAFLTLPITATELEELLAVLFTERSFNLGSKKIQDVIRSLLMLFLKQDRAIEDFFSVSKNCKIFVTGKMLSLISVEHTILSIIDGIGAGVSFEISFFKNELSFAFLSRIFRNKSVGEIVDMSLKDVACLYVPLRYERFKKSGTALVGTSKKEHLAEQFFLLCDEMRLINVVKGMELEITLEEGVFLQNNKSRKIKLNIEKDTKILFDGRLSPIIYGDSYQNNNVQIINWINQLE